VISPHGGPGRRDRPGEASGKKKPRLKGTAGAKSDSMSLSLQSLKGHDC
jgi:hypothetical protein